MKVLIIGGDSRLGIILHNMLDDHEVTITTKDSYDLSKGSDEFLGIYDCVIVCACDFKRGRSDEEQAKCWKTNVDGTINALEHVEHKQVIFVSSYLSGRPTAYGRQKKAVEDWIKSHKEYYIIFRVERIKDNVDYKIVANRISGGIGNYENRCSYISL